MIYMNSKRNGNEIEIENVYLYTSSFPRSLGWMDGACGVGLLLLM